MHFTMSFLILLKLIHSQMIKTKSIFRSKLVSQHHIGKFQEENEGEWRPHGSTAELLCVVLLSSDIFRFLIQIRSKPFAFIAAAAAANFWHFNIPRKNGLKTRNPSYYPDLCSTRSVSSLVTIFFLSVNRMIFYFTVFARRRSLIHMNLAGSDHDHQDNISFSRV